MTNTTLLLLRRNNEILLAMKKRKFGKDKWNGVGGKLELDETIKQAMIRETKEEICVTPTNYEKMAEITFLEYVNDKQEQVNMHVFIATEWQGEPTETEEMAPRWFDIDKLPYDNMFPDDKFWLPKVIDGQKIKAFFKFDEKWNMVSQNIEEVDDF
jgi:ADP-ribose pyrophosphatase